MFSWGAISIPSISVDTDKSRSPPPPATPLDFPSYLPEGHARLEGDPDCEKLHKLLSKLKKPQDISTEFFEVLNLKVEPNVPIADLIPGDATHSFPPFHWPEELKPAETSTNDAARSTQALLNNGLPFPDKAKYDSLREELSSDNSDAFRTLARLDPLPGKPRLRLTHSRKFWTGLEHVAQYWDSSLDQYFDAPENPEAADTLLNTKYHGQAQTPQDLDVEKMDIDRDTTGIDTSSAPGASQPDPNSSTPGLKKLYKGRRIGTGKEMPDAMREDMLRGFLEMIAWSFSCQLSVPTIAPRLFVKGLLFPVRQTLVASRTPKDRQIARKGILEGPVMCVQCRSDTEFQSPEGASKTSPAAICDLLRETAAMLLLAQERKREGTVESKPGSGQWWTSEPRWGGAVNNGPIGEEFDASVPQSSTSNDDTSGVDVKRPKHDRRCYRQRRGSASHSRRRSITEQWKVVAPGPSLWNRKMEYQQIGRLKDSDFDDIFMVSSINHHFAILRLRVHSNYLEWLSTGKADFPAQELEQPWDTIVLRRTRWFDVLKPEDRLEGFDGLWGVFSYLMRPEN